MKVANPMQNVIFPPSIWAATASERIAAQPLSSDCEADIVIVGGGFTGLSAALHLAKRGKRVVLLEAQAVGWGASGRNNGQVIPTMTSAEPDAIAKRYGDAGERFAKLIGSSADTLFSLIRENNINAEAEQTGWFQPAHSHGRVKLSQIRVEAWQRFGFPAEYLDSAATSNLLGSEFWYGGMFNPTGGHINPLAFARGLAKAAENHGVIIHEQSPVTSYQQVGDHWEVRTNSATVRAKGFLLATNAYTGELCENLAPRLARTIVPVLSWQMATAPLNKDLRKHILPGRQAVSDTRGDLRFFRYDARNRLITGGVVMGNYNIEQRIKQKGTRNLAQAFPALGQPEITHVWSGYIGMTWDRFPRVHQLGNNGWAWIGCNGRGVALGTALGREFSRALDGEPLQELALPLSEPSPLPFHSIARRIAPFYLAWLRRKDATEPKL